MRPAARRALEMPCAALRNSARASCSRAAERRGALVARIERGELVLERRLPSEHVRQRRAVFLLEPLELREAIFDGLQPLGRRVEVRAVAAKKEREVVEPRLDLVALLEVRR